MERRISQQVKGYRTQDGAGVSLVTGGKTYRR